MWTFPVELLSPVLSASAGLALWVTAAALNPVEMIYDRETRRLLEYVGTSNMRDLSSGDAYKKVRIVYSSGRVPCQ